MQAWIEKEEAEKWNVTKRDRRKSFIGEKNVALTVETILSGFSLDFLQISSSLNGWRSGSWAPTTTYMAHTHNTVHYRHQTRSIRSEKFIHGCARRTFASDLHFAQHFRRWISIFSFYSALSLFGNMLFFFFILFSFPFIQQRMFEFKYTFLCENSYAMWNLRIFRRWIRTAFFRKRWQK